MGQALDHVEWLLVGTFVHRSATTSTGKASARSVGAGSYGRDRPRSRGSREAFVRRLAQDASDDIRPCERQRHRDREPWKAEDHEP